MKIIVKPPASCSRQELDEFQRLVELGEEVMANGLRRRISGAFLLAFACIGDSVIGVGGLKNPHQSYKKKTFDKSGLTQRCDKFDKELGWVFVIEEHRGKGLSIRLVEAILRDAPGCNIFATSRIDNVAMHEALVKNRFIQSGKPFISARGNKMILFLYDLIAMKAQE